MRVKMQGTLETSEELFKQHGGHSLTCVGGGVRVWAVTECSLDTMRDTDTLGLYQDRALYAQRFASARGVLKQHRKRKAEPGVQRGPETAQEEEG